MITMHQRHRRRTDRQTDGHHILAIPRTWRGKDYWRCFYFMSNNITNLVSHGARVGEKTTRHIAINELTGNAGASRSDALKSSRYK